MFGQLLKDDENLLNDFTIIIIRLENQSKGLSISSFTIQISMHSLLPKHRKDTEHKATKYEANLCRR